jgi:hypothetical protein
MSWLIGGSARSGFTPGLVPTWMQPPKEYKMKKSALWLAGAGAVALGLSGCAASPTPPTASPSASPIMLSARVIPDTPYDSIPVTGTIALDDSCVSIALEDGTSVPVVWPEFGVLEGADPVALVWPNGQATMGQLLSASHGFYMKAGTLDERWEVDDLRSCVDDSESDVLVMTSVANIAFQQ